MNFYATVSMPAIIQFNRKLRPREDDIETPNQQNANLSTAI